MDHHPAGCAAALSEADRYHRLARFLFHTTKLGISSAERRARLMALRVEPQHPAAALAFRAGVHEPADIYVDTSRLPCDHGRRA